MPFRRNDIIINRKINQTKYVYFWHRKLTLKARFWHFLTTRHHVYSQNKIISFEDYWPYWPKICLILYPFLENSTTHITIKSSYRLHLMTIIIDDLQMSFRFLFSFFHFWLWSNLMTNERHECICCFSKPG